MKLDDTINVMDFAKRFITGRLDWRNVPRGGLTNFGNIISLVIYRQPPFQVELFIIPTAPSSFPEHRHPDVDTVEFALAGIGSLNVNGRVCSTQEQALLWYNCQLPSPLVHIQPCDMHSGQNTMPHAFLSIQKWLNGVSPTSVALNWIGEYGSAVQEEMVVKYG